MARNKVIEKAAPGSRDSAEERVIGIIPDIYREKALGGKEQFNLIITDRSLIFALIRPEGGNIPAASYAKKSAAAVLAENKKNFVIEREKLKSVSYRAGHSYTDCCRKLQEIDGELEIVAPDKKRRFYVPFRRNNIAKDLLVESGLVAPGSIVTPSTGEDA